MEKYLAVDFGTKRIGLAVSYASLAEPLTIIANDAQSLNKIAEICSQEKVTAIVVGISEREMAEKSRNFAEEVEKNTGLPIYFADETLSSKTVSTKLHQKNKGKRQYKGHIDHFAAAEFLQEWLELADQ